MSNIDVLLTRRSIPGWEMRAGIESFAHHCASALGLASITVAWSGAIATAAINQHGTLYLTNVRDDARIPRALFRRYVGFVVHELLHRKYTDFLSLNHSGGAVLAALHNACEDIWIERRGIRDGLLGNISGLLTELIGQMVTEAMAQVSDWADPAQYPFALAVTGRRYAPTVPLAGGLRAIFDQASIRIDACQDSHDTLRVARWVMSQLQTPPKDEDGQGKPSKGKPGQGDGQPGDKGDDGKPSKALPSDGQPGDGQPGDDGQPGQGHDDCGQRRCLTASTKTREVEPTLPVGDALEIAQFSRGRSLKPSSYHLLVRALNYPAATVTARLRGEIKRLFDNTGRSEFELSRRTGSINVAALPTISTGNARVFKQRRDTEGVDSAVVLLIDVSASMAGDNQRAAVPACIALLETLAAAQVEVCVMAFSSFCSVIKPWAMPTRKGVEMLRRLHIDGGTKDYPALKLAHEMLLRHPAQRRVCFSLTDGDGDVLESTIQVAAAAALGITTIGVGIRHDVSTVYPQSVRVNTLADLGGVMFKQLKLAA
jgi:Mg-chelatase subunit ChlD